MEDLLREFRERGEKVPLEIKEKILQERQPVIRYVVNRFAARLPANIDRDELYHIATIGLLDAIDKFDPTKNGSFNTYSEFRIRGAILDDLRSQDYFARIFKKQRVIIP